MSETRWHCWSTREGTRGIRAFANQRDLVHTAFEGYAFSGAKHTGFAIETDDNSGGFQVFAGLAHVGDAWVTIGSPALAGGLYRAWKWSLPEVDVLSVRFHDRAVWWAVWHPKHSWTKGTPRWRNGSWHWWDWLTGKPVYATELVEGPVDVVIPMPEGGYRATVTIKRSTWTRPRWPWPKISYGYDADILSRPGPDGPYVPLGSGTDAPRTSGYIPVPGKGENSWDCGGDGIFAMSGPGRTVEKAIGDVVAGALRDRMRYAGRHDYSEAIS